MRVQPRLNTSTAVRGRCTRPLTWGGVVVVTASSVPPVIPKVVPGAGTSAGAVGRGRRPLPIPSLDAAPSTVTDILYTFSTVDKSGRVADRSIIRAVGWPAGTPLDIREPTGGRRRASAGGTGRRGGGAIALPRPR
jgi:hypothetical protein